MSGSRQIEQMCKFILQEANEKANEIRIKTEHDFHKDKQLRVIAANKKTDEAFEKRKIQLESDKKVRLCCVALIPHIFFFEQLFCLSCVSSCFLFLVLFARMYPNTYSLVSRLLFLRFPFFPSPPPFFFPNPIIILATWSCRFQGQRQSQMRAKKRVRLLIRWLVRYKTMHWECLGSV